MRNGLGSRPRDQGRGIHARTLGALRPHFRRRAHRTAPNVTTVRRFLPECDRDDGKTESSAVPDEVIHGLLGSGCNG